MRRQGVGTNSTFQAWKPFGYRQYALTRGRFWTGVLIIAVVSFPINMVCMFVGSTLSEIVLITWVLTVLIFLVPAIYRRQRSSNQQQYLLLVLTLLFFASGFTVVVPLVAMEGNQSDTGAAVFTSFVVWIVCSLPMIFTCMGRDKNPSKA